MAELESSQGSVVHPGVDAQSWLGFEQRMQLRRFDALVVSANRALSSGDFVLARHAIAEARAIRPRALDLADLEARVTQLSTPPGQRRELWRRGANAVGLLLVGSAMFVALDTVRLLPGSLPTIAPPASRLLSLAPPIGLVDLAMLEQSPASPALRAVAIAVSAESAASAERAPAATTAAARSQSPGGGQSPISGSVPTFRDRPSPGAPEANALADDHGKAAPAPEREQKLPEVRPLANLTTPTGSTTLPR
jgi:hypothetical protein